MSKKSFVGGAVILGAAGLVVKLMGAVFRIPVTNWLGGGIPYIQHTAYAGNGRNTCCNIENGCRKDSCGRPLCSQQCF